MQAPGLDRNGEHLETLEAAPSDLRVSTMFNPLLCKSKAWDTNTLHGTRRDLQQRPRRLLVKVSGWNGLFAVPVLGC